ncbi:hypothetical protein EW145_g8080, partial [Phellinidium pouzarii]
MPTPVIIDTDPGVDDIVALLYALASPEIEILAIIISFGEEYRCRCFILIGQSNNVLKLFNALARHFEDFPEDRKRFPNFDSKPLLARGAPGPLEGALHSAQYFHGRDGLGDISNRHPDIGTGSGSDYLRISDRLGYELALELIRAHPPRTITYVALGPLTNLALMARQDPVACRSRLGRVVAMGGALDVPGNTSPVAEFNFFADPYAVKELLIDAALTGTGTVNSTGIPLSRFLLLPLDITTPHELPFPLYAERVDPFFETPGAPGG